MIQVICDRCKKEIQEGMKKYILPVKIKCIRRPITFPPSLPHDFEIIQDKTVELCKECQEALIAFMEEI